MIRATTLRIPSCSGVSWRAQGVVAGTTTEGWQDKRAHGARRLGGCFCSCFRRIPHRVARLRTVRDVLNNLIFSAVAHCAGNLHAR
ncbi:hypothetical protein SDC9_30652 [bioreactor metagenome]|uniref:Uncharacterized protein n=1 Tax=bioreactor metagenome TaxID=1076179 RepID=A0A644V0E4_9ZZZZ